MTDPRAEFGAELQKLRSERDISLEEIARITKVRKAFLESLEAGRFEDLPTDIFVVGFLKAYARHLGLDENAILAHYRMVAVNQEPGKASYLATPKEKRFHLWPLLLLVLLLGGGWGTYWMLQLRGGAPAKPKPAAGPATQAPAPAPAAAQGGIQAPGPQEPVDEAAIPEPSAPGPLQLPSSGAQDPAGPPPADLAENQQGADLVLTAIEPCWVEVWKGEQRIVFRLMEQGERVALKGADFTVTLGNRKAAEVLWQGRPIAPPEGDSPVVSRWRIPPGPGEDQEKP